MKLQKKVITFDPEAADQKNWKLVKELDQNEVDIVVTWQVGARSVNYWKQCLPIALCSFEQEKELR
jgi:hypothetical protein